MLKTSAARSAYVHVPFCHRRCGYCNFTLVAGRDDLIAPYLQAIELELQRLQTPQEVDTVFFGGGTPTRLPPEKLAQLIQLVLHWFPLAKPGDQAPEFSIEANPVDITPEMVEVFCQNQVTRISLGAQSFSTPKLQLLERDHTGDIVHRAVALLQAAGLDVSLDLIFGAPGETLPLWQQDLQTAIDLRPQHISTYGLTFEQGTSFWNRLRRGSLSPLPEDLEREMYTESIRRLTLAGFEHYEVSNFAQPGHRCRHNEVYWLGEPYHAVGPGAARYLNGRREMNHRSTTTWLKRVLGGESPVAEWEELSAEDRARELLVFGLRRLQGISLASFLEQTGFEVAALTEPKLSQFVEAGLLRLQDDQLQLTYEGLFVSDSIWPYFLNS